MPPASAGRASSARQGRDADALATELDTEAKRRRYVGECCGHRFWATPGVFTPEDIDFMTEPFADPAKLRAGLSSTRRSSRSRARAGRHDSRAPMTGCYPSYRMTSSPNTVGVAEAKRRFSELLDRVEGGEHVVVHRRGRPAAVLGPPTVESLDEARPAPLGLAAVAGMLADWDDLDEAVDEIYAARRAAKDRPAPDLG